MPPERPLTGLEPRTLRNRARHGSVGYGSWLGVPTTRSTRTSSTSSIRRTRAASCSICSLRLTQPISRTWRRWPRAHRLVSANRPAYATARDPRDDLGVVQVCVGQAAAPVEPAAHAALRAIVRQIANLLLREHRRARRDRQAGWPRSAPTGRLQSRQPAAPAPRMRLRRQARQPIGSVDSEPGHGGSRNGSRRRCSAN